MNIFATIFPGIFISYIYFLPALIWPAKDTNVTLLLPGFQKHQLEAGIYRRDSEGTTYIITCPLSVPSTVCGIPGNGLTAVKATASAQVWNTDVDGRLASVSCNVKGTTYALCRASYGTIDVQATLAPKHLNWTPVPVTGVHSSRETQAIYSTATGNNTPILVLPSSSPTSAARSFASPFDGALSLGGLTLLYILI